MELIKQLALSRLYFDLLIQKKLPEDINSADWKDFFEVLCRRALPEISSVDREHCRQIIDSKITVLDYTQPDYPTRLFDFCGSPPPVLYIRGDYRTLNDFSIAVVGTRKPTEYGQRVCRDIVNGIPAGIQVISGLARGIDSLAHQQALTRSNSLAVLPCSIMEIYPREHTKLAKLLTEQGALISEVPIGQSPRPFYFLMRNRLIVALSKLVIVIEAAIKSGSLSSGRLALKTGVPVCAVPGSIYSGASAGCNYLISNGAEILFDISGLKRKLSALSGLTEQTELALKIDPLWEKIIDILSIPITVDSLSSKLGIELTSLIITLEKMQDRGMINEINGKYSNAQGVVAHGKN